MYIVHEGEITMKLTVENELRYEVTVYKERLKYLERNLSELSGRVWMLMNHFELTEGLVKRSQSDQPVPASIA